MRMVIGVPPGIDHAAAGVHIRPHIHILIGPQVILEP